MSFPWSSPNNICVRHGTQPVSADAVPRITAPVEVIRKIALLCIARFGLQERADVAVVNASDDGGHIVEIQLLRATVDDELRKGAAITSLVHEALTPTGSIRSVRVTFR